MAGMPFPDRPDAPRFMPPPNAARLPWRSGARSELGLRPPALEEGNVINFETATGGHVSPSSRNASRNSQQASPSPSDSGMFLLHELTRGRLDEADERRAVELIREIIADPESPVSRTRLAWLLSLEEGEEGPTVDIDMRLGPDTEDADTGAAVKKVLFPNEEKAFAGHTEAETDKEWRSIPGYDLANLADNLVLEAIEVSLSEVNRDLVERILLWADELLGESDAVAQERLNNPLQQTIHAALLRMLLKSIVLHSSDLEELVGMEAPSLTNRQHAVNIMLFRAKDAGDALCDEIIEEDSHIQIDHEGAACEVTLKDFLQTHLKVAHFSSLLQLSSVSGVYLDMLAQQAYELLILKAESLDEIQDRIASSNDPSVMATRAYIVKRSGQISK